MKISFILFFSLLAIQGYCQDTLSIAYSDKTEAIVSRLTRELNLDRKQQKDVSQLLQKQWKAISNLRSEDFESQRLKIRKAALNDFKNILTEKQYAVYVRLKEEKDENKKEFLAQHPGYRFNDEDEDLDF